MRAMSATPSVLAVIEGLRQRIKEIQVKIATKRIEGKRSSFHERPGARSDQKKSAIVTDSSQPRLVSGMKCSRKLHPAITIRTGTMKASHGDSRGKSRRK